MGDYAFVHFEKREDAFEAMNGLAGEDICGSTLDISWAKPPSDKKKKEEMLRKREQRMMETMAKSMTFPIDPDYYEYNDLQVYHRLRRADGSKWGYCADNMRASNIAR